MGGALDGNIVPYDLSRTKSGVIVEFSPLSLPVPNGLFEASDNPPPKHVLGKRHDTAQPRPKCTTSTEASLAYIRWGTGRHFAKGCSMKMSTLTRGTVSRSFNIFGKYLWCAYDFVRTKCRPHVILPMALSYSLRSHVRSNRVGASFGHCLPAVHLWRDVRIETIEDTVVRF